MDECERAIRAVRRDAQVRRFQRLGCTELSDSNRVRGANGSRYDYPRYMFSNRSAEVRQLFVDGCDRLGLASRQMNAWTISAAQRSSVAALDRIVGPKY